MNLSHFLYILSVASPLVPILTGIRVRGLLWYYVLLSGLCDGLTILRLFPETPHWNGNIFLAAQFVLVNAYFIQELLPKGERRTLAWVLVGCITAAFLFYTIRQGFWDVNYPAGAVLIGLLIIPVLGGFYDIMRREQVLHLERSPFFIFCAAFLLYVSGSFLIMVYAPRFKTEDHRALILMWVSIHNSLNILKNGAIARALYLYAHPRPAHERP